MKNLGLVGAILVAIVVLIPIVWQSAPPPAPSAPPPAGGTALAAPDAASVTLDGKKWRLRDHRGKVVLLDFWATWCPPCVASMPEVRETYEKFKNHPEFLLVGVSQDYTRSQLEEFVKQHDIPWPQLFDPAADNEMADKFGVHMIPILFLIDRDGNIAGKFNSAREASKEIERMLKAPA